MRHKYRTRHRRHVISVIVNIFSNNIVVIVSYLGPLHRKKKAKSKSRQKHHEIQQMWIWSHLKSYYNLSLAFCCLLWKKNLPCLFRLRFLVISFLDIQIFFLQKHSIRNHQSQSQNIFLPCLISIYVLPLEASWPVAGACFSMLARVREKIAR